MKNIKVLITVLLVSIVSGLQAQIPLKVKEQSAPPFKLKAYDINDVFKMSDGYWSISNNGVNYYVTNYDRNFVKTSGDYVEFKYEGKHLRLESIKRFRGEYLFFLSYDNVKLNKKFLFFTVFDPYDLETSPELKKISELKLGTKRTTSPKFDIRLSRDEKNIVVIGIPPSNISRGKKGFVNWLFGRSGSSSSDSKSKTGYVKFSFWVMNTQQKIVNYEKNHRMEIEEAGDKFIFEDFTVDEDGTIYMLGRNQIVDRLTSGERRKKNTKKWVEYEKSAFILEQIHPDGSVGQYVTEQGVLYNDMQIVIDSKGKLNLVGLLAEELYSSLATTGIERNVLDPSTLELLSQTTEDFTEEVLDKVNALRNEDAPKTKRQKKRQAKREKRMTQEEKDLLELAKRAALRMNTIAFLELDNDDNPVMVLEEQYLIIVVTTTTDANGNTTTRTDYYYHYDDIIVVRFEDGDVYQNAFKKSFVSVNYELNNPIDVSVDDEFITIAAQDMLIRTDKDVAEFASYKIKGSRPNGKKLKSRSLFSYRKVLDESTMVYANLSGGKKVTWVKATIK